MNPNTMIAPSHDTRTPMSHTAKNKYGRNDQQGAVELITFDVSASGGARFSARDETQWETLLLESLVEEPKNNTPNADTQNHDPSYLLRGKASIAHRDLCQIAYDAMIKAEEPAAVIAGSLRRLRAIDTGTSHETSSASYWLFVCAICGWPFFACGVFLACNMNANVIEKNLEVDTIRVDPSRPSGAEVEVRIPTNTLGFLIDGFAYSPRSQGVPAFAILNEPKEQPHVYSLHVNMHLPTKR